MRLFVARHGETQWNLEDKVCGSTDLPLTEKGLAQAQALADKVAAIKPDVIVASTMLRARQTAAASARRCGSEIITDGRFVEQEFGSFEGASRFDPEFLARRRDFAARFPGGESILEVAHRVYSGLEDLKARYPGKTVLLVCHGSVSRIIRTYFADMPNEEFFTYLPGNGELVYYELS